LVTLGSVVAVAAWIALPGKAGSAPTIDAVHYAAGVFAEFFDALLDRLAGDRGLPVRVVPARVELSRRYLLLRLAFIDYFDAGSHQ
jgi:hypothetical protein